MAQEGIQFGRPAAFLLLWLVPVLVGFAWWVERRRVAASLAGGFGLPV